MSEWLKVMIEEIARLRAEAEQARIEFVRRRQESGAQPESGANAGPGTGPAGDAGAMGS